jgi:hypothetical protein
VLGTEADRNAGIIVIAASRGQSHVIAAPQFLRFESFKLFDQTRMRRDTDVSRSEPSFQIGGRTIEPAPSQVTPLTTRPHRRALQSMSGFGVLRDIGRYAATR